MTFVSPKFLLFIALVLCAYFVAPKKVRWIVLLVASYAFYYLSSGKLLLIHMMTTIVTFVVARWIYAINEQGKRELAQSKLPRKEKKALRAQIKRKARPVLVLGICVVLSLLLVLKYYNFFADNINSLLGASRGGLPYLSLLLPIGISFYTLQAIAYMVDVYRGKCLPDSNIFKFALFMSFFPQIVQGPIPRYKQLANQLYEPHDFDYVRVCHGAQLVLWGWIQKMIIADRLAIPVNEVFEHYENYHGLLVFLAAAGYGLQVYTDFSGGMDIARGVSQMLGIELELNFKQPYFSTSIEDFWRRWHITLGSWMKNYVFYPLSLSRSFATLSRRSRKFLGDFVGKRLPPILAMFIVYFLVGFWHGADWKYIAYGVWNGIFLVLGILLPEQYARWADACHIDRESFSWRAFQITRTFCICSLGRLFSRGVSFTAAISMFSSIGYRWRDLSFLYDGTFTALGLATPEWFVLIAFVAILLLVDRYHERGGHIRESIDRQNLVFRWTVYIGAIVAILIFGSYGSGFEAVSFIYSGF